MTHFEHMGSYKDGAFPSYKKAPKLYRVNYDQLNDVYLVPDGEYFDFIDWVALHWEDANAFQGEDEAAQDYLDRIGVSVFEV